MKTHANLERLAVVAVLSIVMASLTCQSVCGQDSLVAGLDELIPADSIAYLEITRPTHLVNRIVDHPAIAAALETSAAKQALVSPQYLQFRVGLGLLEGAVGTSWHELVNHLTGRGMCMAIGDDGKSFVIVARSDDEAILRKTIGTILNFVENQSQNPGRPPFMIEETTEGKLAIFDGFTLGRNAADLVVTNSKATTLEILGALATKRSKSGHSIGTSEQFIQARAADSREHDVWAFVDLDKIRERGVAKELFSGMADNPGVELIFGGILENLKDSGWSIASLDLSNEFLKLSLVTEHNPAKMNPAREYFFGPGGRSAAPARVDSTGMVASLTAWRDLAGWWLSKEELFDDGTVAALVQADSQISTLFSGLDFGGEVLGALEPGVQFVVDQQGWETGKGPTIKLPSFALTGQLKDADRMGRKFKNAFQSVMGFVNIQLSMQGQPQFDVNTSNTDNGSICSSSMFDDPDVPTDLLVHNFSPTLIVHDDRLTISSTMALAKKIAGQHVVPADGTMKIGNAAERAAGFADNTVVKVDLEQVLDILEQNRESLVAQNMLENGHNRTTANAEIDSLLALAGLLRSFDLGLGVGDAQMTLDLTLGFGN